MSESIATQSDRVPRSRATWIVWVGMVCCLAGLRVMEPSRLAVEHYDEGVYASEAWFEGGYPQRHLYAPPLFPWLVKWSVRAFGPTLGPFVPSLLAGCLTVALAGCIARAWFGDRADGAALALVGLSGYHIAYCRAALTDALLCLWLLAAVGCLHRALVGRDRIAILLAGLCTGLAWCTKYNGWLPLAIGLAGGLAFCLDNLRLRRGADFKPLLCWALVAVIAGVVFAPVLWSLEATGGYGAVAANHRGYLVGFDGWCESFRRQLDNLRLYDDWASALAVALVWLIGSTPVTWRGGNLAIRLIGWGVAVSLFGAALLVGSHVMLALLAVLGIAANLFGPLKSSDPSCRLACWLLAAWFCGLLLATPFYRPYPRLMLPWVASCWLGAAAAVRVVDGVCRQAAQRVAPRGSRMQAAAGAACILVGVALTASAIVQGRHRRPVASLPDRTPLLRATSRLLARAVPPSAKQPQIVLVYAEPAVVYHINAIDSAGGAEGAANRLALPIADVTAAFGVRQRLGKRFADARVLLLIGPHARRTAAFAKQWERYAARFRHIESVRHRASVLVLANHYEAAQLLAGASPLQTLELYELQ